jgi:hypothetical protein
LERCLRPLLRPRTDHACPQKPNPSREKVPLTPIFSHKIGIIEKSKLAIGIPGGTSVRSFLKIVRLYVDMKLDRMVLDYVPVPFYNMFIILSFYHRLHGCRCFYAPYLADLLHSRSVTNWPPGSGSIILNYGSDSGSFLFIEDLKKFLKCQYFDELVPYLFDNIIFPMAIKCPARIRIWPDPFLIGSRTRFAGLRILES